MGYLICRKCKGYYQLEEDEHPDDFDSCQCGGELVYTEDFDDINKALACANMNDDLEKKIDQISDLDQIIKNKRKKRWR